MLPRSYVFRLVTYPDKYTGLVFEWKMYACFSTLCRCNYFRVFNFNDTCGFSRRGSIYTYDSWGLRRPDLSFKLLTRALFTGIFLLVIAFTTFFCGKYRTNFFYVYCTGFNGEWGSSNLDHQGLLNVSTV